MYATTPRTAHRDANTHTQRKARHNSGTQKHTHAYIQANKKRVYAHNNRHILANADGSPALAMAAPAAAAEGHGTGAYWLRSHKYPLTDTYTHTHNRKHAHLATQARLFTMQKPAAPNGKRYMHCLHAFLLSISLARSLSFRLYLALLKRTEQSKPVSFLLFLCVALLLINKHALWQGLLNQAPIPRPIPSAPPTTPLHPPLIRPFQTRLSYKAHTHKHTRACIHTIHCIHTHTLVHMCSQS